MKLQQKKLLLELYYKKIDGFIYENNPFDILIHSVLNTIKFENLIKIYVNNDLQELNSSIFSNLNKRISSESNVENIYENLKELIELNNNYNYSQRLRVTLEFLLQKLPDDYKIDYFNTYFYSKYLNDKKSALKYLQYSKKNINIELVKLYVITKNKLFLTPILKRKNKNFITANFYKIWEEDLNFYYKKKIIETIIPLEPKIEIFIKTKEPDVYFYYQLLNKKITNKDFIDKIENSTEDKKAFYIWQASKYLKFESIEQFIKKHIR